MKRFISITLAIALVATFFVTGCGKESGERILNVLAWVGYEEREMLEPFEKKYNVKVSRLQNLPVTS